MDILCKDGTALDLKTTRWMTLPKLTSFSNALQVNINTQLLPEVCAVEVNRLFIQYVDMSGPTKCRKCNTTVQMIDGQLLCPKCLAAPREAHLGARLVEIPMMGEEEVKEFVERKVGILSEAMRTGVLPEAEPSWLCNYCSSLSRCEEGMSFLG